MIKSLNLTTAKRFEYEEHLQQITKEYEQAQDKASELGKLFWKMDKDPTCPMDEYNRIEEEYEKALEIEKALDNKREAWEEAIDLLKKLEELESYILIDCKDYTFAE